MIRNSHPIPGIIVLLGIMTGLGGCLVGIGEPEDHHVVNDLGFTTSPDFVVMDLDAGTIEPRVDIADLTTNPRWKTSHVAFHRVPAISGTTLGLNRQQDDSLADFLQNEDRDEHPSKRGPISHPTFYLGVFELTRGQWRRLGGSPTWKDDDPSLTGDPDREDLPASGMSRDQIMMVLAGISWADLRLPTRDEWESACRGPGLGLYAWGDDASVAASYAVLQPLDGLAIAGDIPSALAPVAGNRRPNVFQLFDLHGNVAELVAPELGEDIATARICGGSWQDTTLTARATNKVVLPSDEGHPLVGLRLVVTP